MSDARTGLQCLYGLMVMCGALLLAAALSAADAPAASGMDIPGAERTERGVPADDFVTPGDALGSRLLNVSSGREEAPLTANAEPLPASPWRSAEPFFASTFAPLDEAKNEALSVLRGNLIERGGRTLHSAGPGYDAPWIRDSFAWGMIPSDAYPQLVPYATSELRYWLERQTPAGQWVSNPMSGFYDETAIMLCAAVDAYRVTGDKTLLAESLPRLRKGWAWLRGNPRGRESTYLLWTPVQTTAALWKQLPISVDWVDQVARANYAGQLNLLWYRATQCMAIEEAIVGSQHEAERYMATARQIKADFNRLFWSQATVSGRNAAPAPAFGHYRSWYPASRDYFELDTNFEAILYGVADVAQRRSILSFVEAHAEYLLGSPNGGPPPAKTVYGDYAPADYAVIRNKLGDGMYHNAYWPSIGSLAARAFAQAGQPAMTWRTLAGLARAFPSGQGSASGAEWYRAVGTTGGVPEYQWSARLYLDALFRAYLGVDDDWANPRAENLSVRPLFGGASGKIRHAGKTLSIRTHGEGNYRYAVVDGHIAVNSNIIAEALLHDGATLDLYLAGRGSSGDDSLPKGY
jgi:hypothetical protein